MPRLLGEIGTIEWCRRTNGILGRGERARYLASVALTTARFAPRLVAARAGARGSGPDPSQLAPPDTPFAREVLEACADLDPMLVEHGYRSYLFGRALGIAKGLECDEEALFAAAILHDYAFQNLDAITDSCFTLVGADVAADLLATSPLSEALRHDVLDAITVHNNPAVGAEQGAVQHLLHDGVMVDVLGVHGWRLDSDGVDRVAEQHPRHGFSVRGEQVLRAYAKRVPGCRANALFAPGFGATTAVRLGRWRSWDRVASGQAATAL